MESEQHGRIIPQPWRKRDRDKLDSQAVNGYGMQKSGPRGAAFDPHYNLLTMRRMIRGVLAETR